MAIWAAGWITLISSCAIQPDKDSYQLTRSEKAICDSLKLDPSIIRDLRKYTAAEVEPFHYSRSKMYANNTVTELEPIRLTGVIF
ncbi:hypothetical protein [Niabella beijingensis]|uniref:hypothetical protein n=1 Tax=Niabella beijingensis TaxID=2872700 RepID=UPI001CBA7D50|nr:hypothetical protein [Niabella beijingensis]MBZ4189614.1 hypothetical protein [Niabella beijingensis]